MFFITPTTFRNTTLQDRCMKKHPILSGPIMILYRCSTESYREILAFIKQEIGESVEVILDSDGEKGIKTAVKRGFSKSFSFALHATR